MDGPLLYEAVVTKIKMQPDAIGHPYMYYCNFDKWKTGHKWKNSNEVFPR